MTIRLGAPCLIILLSLLSGLLPLRLRADDATQVHTSARQSPFQSSSTINKARNNALCNGSLSDYPLDKLRYVGSVELASERWGLIRLPDASLVSVQKGSVLGKDCGEIVQISMQKLLIKEKIFMADKWEEKLRTLVLERTNKDGL